MMENSVCSEEVSLVFVIPEGLTEDTCAPSLICAYQACMETDLNPLWKTSSDCLTLRPGKKDVFVCDPFEGDAFRYLKSDQFKSVVLGPRCLLSCLHRKMVVPELPSPLHNISMHKLIITLSGFEKEEREELSTIITRSSGIYANNFSEAVTHLVANTVGSKKYIVAVERDIPVMTGEWLRAVWNAVSREYREDIYATDEQFLSYTCPIFQNLVICVSQMPKKNKVSLKKIIEENGGTYSASLEMSITSVLIVPSPEGEKYDYARNWRIHCLKPDWIYDSVEIGHALNMDGYEVKHRGASTPTDENATNGKVVSGKDHHWNVPPDVSMCSTIMITDPEMSRAVTHVNETLQQSTLADISIVKRKSVSDEHASRGLMAVEELDLQKALKAGHFLDGCKIFLSGFSGTHMEKLRRVLNAGGATRFSQLTESVSHVIIGKVVEEHMNTILSWSSKPHVVYGDWITESIQLQKPAEEAQFSYAQDKKSSPKKPETSSRKSSLSENRKSLQDSNETFVDEELMKKYLKPPGANRVEETMNLSSFPDSQQSTIPGIFHGKIFTFTGYSQKISEDFITTIRENGGEVASLDYEGDVDYSITDVEGSGAVHERAKEIVTHDFIDDCLDVDKHTEPVLVDVEYYHLPSKFIKGEYPLRDCVIAISAYTGVERQFLISLAGSLGAKFQLSFAKKNNPAKNVRASTHLICSSASGEKYKAALIWKVPAVTHNWVIACARSGTKENEDIYRVDVEDPVILDSKNIIRNLFDVNVLGSKTFIGETAVGDTIMGEIAATPVNSKVRSLREEKVFQSPREIKTPDMETIRKMYPTPRASKGNQSLDEMPTPDTPYGRTWQANPPARVRKAYKRLLDSLPDEPPMKKPADQGTPVEVYYKRFQDKVSEDFKNFRVKTPVWYKKKDVNTDKDSKDEETLVEDKEEKIEETEDGIASENQGPLAGVVVCTAHKHHDQQRALYEAVTKLGGDYRWSLDNSVTHFIFHGQNNDKTREFRTARDEGKIIVAPEWVWMCQDENKKIDEELFPHTHNPKMSLSLMCTKNNTNNKRGRPRKKHFSGEGKDEDNKEEEMESITNNTSLKMSSEMNESLSKQLEEIEALASACGPERRSVSRNKSISEKLKHTPTREVQVETQPVMMDLPETQNTAVTWDDPQEREARLRLQDQLTRNTQDIISGNMQTTSEESEEDKENLPVLTEEESTQEPSTSPCIASKTSLSPEQNYLFVLSGVLDEDRDRYVAIIVGLGGAMTSDQHFDVKCTHVITVKPTRSEKTLAAIASGKWLLHTSFLEDSGKAGRFLEEEPYEFGNPSANYVSAMNKDSLEYRLSMCALRWRLTLSRDRKKLGAFHGMKALVHSNRDRTEAFKRLILAGGGEVLSATPPYRDVKGISHFFIELNKNPGLIDFAFYASQRIPCLNPLYLNEYLVNDPAPDESDHYTPEYKEILKDMSDANTSLIRRRKK